MSERSVRNYCAKGRVNGAFLTGKTWNLPENAAYLKSWIKAIREEPKFILNVLADAMKIVKMIAGKLNISVESEETAADEAEQVA